MINPAVLIKRQTPEGWTNSQGIKRLVAIGANPVRMGNDTGDFALLSFAVKKPAIPLPASAARPNQFPPAV